MIKKHFFAITLSILILFSVKGLAYDLDDFKKEVVDLPSFLKAVTPILPSEYAPQTEGTIDVREIGKDQYTLDIANLYLIPANQVTSGKVTHKIRLGQFSINCQKHADQKGFHFKALLPGTIKILGESDVPTGEIHIHQGTLEGDWDYSQKAVSSLTLGSKAFDITDALKQPLLEIEGLTISEKIESLRPQSLKSSLVYDITKLWHHESKTLPSIKVDQFKIISRSEGMSKDHYQNIFELITYLSLLKPMGLAEWNQDEAQVQHQNLERLEPSINGLHVQFSLKNVTVNHQIEKYDLTFENLEQHIDLQNLDQNQFGLLVGFRLDNPHLLNPSLPKNILPEVVMFNITGEKIPQTAFWTAVRQFLVDSHLPGNKINLDWSLPPFIKAMKQAGTQFRINRALYENDVFKLIGQGNFNFKPLAERDMTAQANFTVKDIDSFIHQLTAAQIQNPDFGLFSTLITLKLMREIGIPQEGVRKPSEREYDFTLDEAGNMKLNHFAFPKSKK
ncbi:MAG: hypothetical protein KBE16_02620 [Alphaproteobacteria bacterium]|jgi:hypothetical protein|nr:hypothetical protein [Alphaproteobacteria bacterium]MBP9876702.1 hypothetical protein [Alphaproteobacteria bacterium]